MCGFAGVIAFSERCRVSHQRLAAMSAAVSHRGPDGEAFWQNHDADVTVGREWAAMAFRRLAVIDPDPRSMQPFHIGSRSIVFNGEIYNYRELRKELSSVRPDYAWRTDGDAEVLLLAADTWGERCLEKLNGMFAIAVWDEASRTLMLARDRLGQKPLYYTVVGAAWDSTGPVEAAGIADAPGDADASHAVRAEGIVFASELPAILASGLVDSAVDSDSLTHYLRLGYLPHPRTIYRQVRQLEPGRWIRFDSAGSAGGKYWGLARNPTRLGDAEAATATRHLLTQAVQRQRAADVPLGCFLSGGVDSSVIAAVMARHADANQPVHTFSIGFDDPRYDESRYAQRVAEHLGTVHRMFHVRPDAAADLPKIAAAFGEPFADSSALPTHYLSQQTRQHVTVALSGDGGDELFGGYDRYRAIRLDALLRRMPNPIRRVLAATWAGHPPGGHPKSIRSRAGRFLRSVDQPAAVRYSGYLRLFDDRTLASILAPNPPVGEDAVAACFDSLGQTDPVEAALAVDRLTYLPGDLLTKVDRCSMLHALEVRSPFMDHALVEMASGLTADQLLGGGPKRMLREAFAADLPAWVFKRKKMGFAVPIGQWFRSDPPLRAMLHDGVTASDGFAASNLQMTGVRRLFAEHDSGEADHSQRLYALLMLELWWQSRR